MTRPTSTPIRKVLFVDGEGILREVYREEARRGGLRPLVAGDAAEAWALFESEQPDVVVTDLDLPDPTSGAELIAKLRATPLGAVIPIIATSPGKRDIRGVTDAVIQHDVDDFLDKPVHGERLMWRIRELVEGRPIGAITAEGRSAGLERPVTIASGTDFLQGSLEDADVAALLYSFFATGRSGKLCVMAGREVVQIWFRRGWIVFVESNLEGMEFGDWLVGRGKLGEARLAAAREEWASVDRSLGVVLVSRGHLGARTMFDEMRANIDALVMKLLAWTEGTFYIEYSQNPAEYVPPEAVSLQRSPAHFVVTGVRDHYSRARCAEMLRAATGTLEVAEAAHFILRELVEPYYYENVLAQLGDGGNAAKLLEMHPFNRDDDALRAVTALWIVGGLIERVTTEVLRTEVRKSEHGTKADRIRRAVASAVGVEHPERRAAREARVKERLTRKRAKRAARRQSEVASIMSELDKVSADVAYEKGIRLMGLRRYEDAARALHEAITLAPHNAGWYSKLAQSYLAQEQAGPAELDAALKTLKRGAALDPHNGEPYHWLGMVLMRMGHPEEARITLRRSIELGSPHVEESRTLLEALG